MYMHVCTCMYIHGMQLYVLISHLCLSVYLEVAVTAGHSSQDSLRCVGGCVWVGVCACVSV